MERIHDHEKDNEGVILLVFVFYFSGMPTIILKGRENEKINKEIFEPGNGNGNGTDSVFGDGFYSSGSRD